MYVCFFDEKDDRSWEKYDVKFLNDTKRVIQSILTKKITTNSLAGSYASLEAILENSGCGIYVADMSKSEILYMNNYCKQLLSNIIEQNKLEKYIFSHTAESRSFTEVYVTEEDKWFDIHRTGIAWWMAARCSSLHCMISHRRSVISSALRTRPIMIS